MQLKKQMTNLLAVQCLTAAQNSLASCIKAGDYMAITDADFSNSLEELLRVTYSAGRPLLDDALKIY